MYVTKAGDLIDNIDIGDNEECDRSDPNVCSLSPQADSHGTRFINDLKSAVSKPIAFDAIVRVRTSTGERPLYSGCTIYLVALYDITYSSRVHLLSSAII